MDFFCKNFADKADAHHSGRTENDGIHAVVSVKIKISKSNCTAHTFRDKSNLFNVVIFLYLLNIIIEDFCRVGNVITEIVSESVVIAFTFE